MMRLKVLLCSVFVFTAIIRSAEVGVCGPHNHRQYPGIKATFDVINEEHKIVSSSYQCGANWPDIKQGIKQQLDNIQEIHDQNAYIVETQKRLQGEAKELIGARIQGDR